jgi:hypothetical protein
LESSGRPHPEKESLGEWGHDATTRNGSTRKSMGASGGLFNAMHIGMESSGTRKIYSLAPCHHLFVGFAISVSEKSKSVLI